MGFVGLPSLGGYEVIPGSITLTPGTTSLVCPNFYSIDIYVAGAGGGSGGQPNNYGASGGDTILSGLVAGTVDAGGGAGGGAAGTAGTYNGYNGGNGGGSAPSGWTQDADGGAGQTGEGNGPDGFGDTVYGGVGGNGARFYRLSIPLGDPNAPVPGQTYSVSIGQGGGSGYGQYYTAPAGGDGWITLAWR